MLSVVMLSVVMLSGSTLRVVTVSGVILDVVAPGQDYSTFYSIFYIKERPQFIQKI